MTKLLAKITSAANLILTVVGAPPLTQKFVAHLVTVGLTGVAVALLPLGISSQLNGLIVVIAGLAAHWIAPKG